MRFKARCASGGAVVSCSASAIETNGRSKPQLKRQVVVSSLAADLHDDLALVFTSGYALDALSHERLLNVVLKCDGLASRAECNF
jgi:hypothetical protein